LAVPLGLELTGPSKAAHSGGGEEPWLRKAWWMGLEPNSYRER